MAAVHTLKNIMRVQTAKGLGRVLKKMQVVSASEGKCTMQLFIEEAHVNTSDYLHGGTVATIVDMVTTNALELSPLQRRGVSVDLSISYLRPVKMGDEITIDAWCVKVGRLLAFLEADVKDKNGKLIATGKQSKFVGESS